VHDERRGNAGPSNPSWERRRIYVIEIALRIFVFGLPMFRRMHFFAPLRILSLSYCTHSAHVHGNDHQTQAWLLADPGPAQG
jgi:hypothetical protein